MLTTGEKSRRDVTVRLNPAEYNKGSPYLQRPPPLSPTGFLPKGRVTSTFTKGIYGGFVSMVRECGRGPWVHQLTQSSLFPHFPPEQPSLSPQPHQGTTSKLCVLNLGLREP